VWGVNSFMVMMMVVVYENGGPKKNIWEVLVGAFSDFGGLDTDNPVQIWAIFEDFTLFRFPKGLI